MINNKAVRQALYQKLNVASVTSLLASGSASIVHGVAPPTAGYPLVIFTKQSGINDLKVMGGDDARNTLWLVKGVAKGSSSSAAEDVDKAVSDLLHFGDLTITGGDDLYLARESDVEYVETSGDTQYRHVGGVYRLIYQD
jgi:hypothetical protein